MESRIRLGQGTVRLHHRALLLGAIALELATSAGHEP